MFQEDVPEIMFRSADFAGIKWSVGLEAPYIIDAVYQTGGPLTCEFARNLMQVTYGDFRKKFKSARLPLKSTETQLQKQSSDLEGRPCPYNTP